MIKINQALFQGACGQRYIHLKVRQNKLKCKLSFDLGLSVNKGTFLKVGLCIIKINQALFKGACGQRCNILKVRHCNIKLSHHFQLQKADLKSLRDFCS